MITIKSLDEKDFCLIKILANRTRWEIVMLLAENDDCSVGFLAEKIGVPMTNVSHALAYLEAEKIVQLARVQGKKRFYSMN